MKTIVKPGSVGIGIERWYVPIDPDGRLMTEWGIDVGIVIEEAEMLPDGTRKVTKARLVESSICKKPLDGFI